MELNSLTLGPTIQAPQQKADPAIEKKAQEFEALFLAQMLKPMFETLKTESLFGEGPEQDAYNTMLNDAFADAIAARGGVGIADSVKTALINLQSNNQNSK